MDARLTAEQRQLQAAADALAARHGPRTVGDLDDQQRRLRLGAAITQAGWRELRAGVPAEPAASGVEVALVARSLARRVTDTAFLGPVLALDLLRRAGITGCQPIPTVAVGADHHLAVATAGAVPLAIDAGGSTSALVLLPGSRLGEIRLAGARRALDLTRPVAPASGSASAVDGAAPLSAGDLTRWAALAVTLTAADLVGAMEGALSLATEYAGQRRQYGAPIGSYQAVQHMLAEAAALIEGAVSITDHAAWAVDALAPDDARRAAAAAKAYAARAARTVCETAIQVHGGIGNTWECMAHVFLRRCLTSTQLFGGDRQQLALLASERWGAAVGL